VDYCLHFLGLGDPINTRYYRQPLMKKLDIVPPNENFRGRSYGEWASEWLKWVVSGDPDTYSKEDPIIFLRANIDYSQVEGAQNGYRENATTHFDRTLDKGIDIYGETAIFFPVVEANFMIGCKNPEDKKRLLKTEEELRYYARKDIDSGWELGSYISRKNRRPRPLVNNLKHYRAESQLFKIHVPEKSHLKNKMEEELGAGTFDAVTDGYWILIRELRPDEEPYRIYFEANKGTYYHYSATYDISVSSRPRSKFQDKSSSIVRKYR
jgi:hypothetical protein